MKLQEAVAQSRYRSASKRVDSPVAGTYTFDKANLSAGYYKDFKADDPSRHERVSTTVYYGYDTFSDPFTLMIEMAGEDGWMPR